jgi:hypothetical protein
MHSTAARPGLDDPRTAIACGVVRLRRVVQSELLAELVGRLGRRHDLCDRAAREVHQRLDVQVRRDLRVPSNPTTSSRPDVSQQQTYYERYEHGHSPWRGRRASWSRARRTVPPRCASMCRRARPAAGTGSGSSRAPAPPYRSARRTREACAARASHLRCAWSRAWP